MSISLINPATGETIRSYEYMREAEVEKRIIRANEVYASWRKTSMSHRAERMMKAAAILREGKEKYARLMGLEMGKPIREARGEVEKCAWVCEYYAGNAAAFLADETVVTDASLSFISYQPIGVVLAVMPWNFPFWQVFRFAAPALMAGNAGLLKHASNVPGCAEAIEEIFLEAGFPKGLFANLKIPGSRVAAVIRHPVVKAVTLTGSGPAGSAVASAAGGAIKKTVLELGGSDAYLILRDANLGLAAKTCAQSRLLNAGQSCIGAKRFIVVPEVYDAFLEKFLANMAAAKMGSPYDETTDLGPMARHDLREELHSQVLRSIEKGAVCLLGGAIPEGNPGAYYPATVLAEVAPGMPAWEEELFGPVAAVIRAQDEAGAICIANSSVFGLGAAVFTEDVERGQRIAAIELEAGACFVNGMVKSDPRLPFGGIKQSGFGRELSVQGIREFVNAKTVWVR
ncbi:MAG: NAD-dependent succinate-semialdehyde dehydrogenase [Saprospiraceae bacterium]|nr:MAG: NAD-dependent succinate-semialdehyde dehydrogenase [Saprospiraceae bacterium]